MALTTVKSDQIQTSVALAGSPTTTTQSASDNSTKVATTAYVETAVANLVASAPSALNTLDELAAALNDDASFSTTVTNSIATKLPLAGGTLTGNLLISNSKLNVGGTTMSELLNVQTGSSSATAMVEFRNTQAGTQIGMPANINALVLQTADTARLRIESNGNVHINHSSFSSFPTNAKFTVFGDGEVLRIDGSGNTTRKFRFRNVTDANPGVIVADGSLKLETEDSNTDIILMPIANVGIGTASPEGLLHIEKGSSGVSYTPDGADQVIIENSDSMAIDIRTPANKTGVIMFSDPDARARGLIQYAHATDTMFFNTSGANRITVDSGGTVGIGTTDLHSWATFDGRLRVGARAFFGTTTGSSQMGYNWYYDGAYKYIAGDYANRYIQNDGHHWWQNATSGSADGTITWVSAMRLNRDGRLALGPDHMDILIDPASTNSGNNLIYLRGNASGEKSEIQLNHYGHADYHIGVGHDANGTLNISNTQTGNNFVFISSGNVGINLSTPPYKLTVIGETYVEGLLNKGYSSLGENADGQTDVTTLQGYGVLSGSTRYGKYGVLRFNSSANFTGSSRGYMITNGYGANQFAILQSTSATTMPDIASAGGGASNGHPIFVSNNAGHITMPKQPSAIRAVAGGGLSGVNCNGQYYQIYFSTSIRDEGSMHSQISGGGSKFTAPVAGVYFFSCIMRVDAFTGNYFYLDARINGTTRSRNLTSNTGNYLSFEVVGTYYLGSGDFITFEIANSGDSSVNIDDSTHAYIHLLG